MITILVCGDRNWTNEQVIRETLGKFKHPKSVHVVHGAARGADEIGGRVAKELGMTVTEVPAEWNKFGRAAGVFRNRKMFDEFHPEAIFAFHSNLAESKGTKNMVEYARSKGCTKIMVIADPQITPP
jgi:hypothetical protein